MFVNKYWMSKTAIINGQIKRNTYRYIYVYINLHVLFTQHSLCASHVIETVQTHE